MSSLPDQGTKALLSVEYELLTDQGMKVIVSAEYKLLFDSEFLIDIENAPDEININIPGVKLSLTEIKQSLLNTFARSTKKKRISQPEQNKETLQTDNRDRENLTDEVSENTGLVYINTRIVYKVDKCVHCGRQSIPGSTSCYNCDDR